jgi:hypothetical protein
MAKKLDPRLVEILDKYHPDPKSAVWDCHGVWVIYHKAVELIAAKAGVQFDPPQVIVADQASKNVAICVTGRLGATACEWSIGECAPYNNKNSYPFAMAEKRAKDRVVLKLLGLHGEIYSEDEADDFKPNSRQKDDDVVDGRRVAESHDDYVVVDLGADDLIAEIQTIPNNAELFSWGRKYAAVISRLPRDGEARVRKAYLERRKEFVDAEAA